MEDKGKEYIHNKKLNLKSLQTLDQLQFTYNINPNKNNMLALKFKGKSNS